MSTAVIEAPVQSARTLSFPASTPPVEPNAPRLVDEHPFAIVAVFIAISLAAAGAFVGSILFWLALHDSGVLGVKI